MKQFQPDNKEFSMDIFDAEIRPGLRNIVKILGKEDDNAVDKSVLQMFTLMMKSRKLLDIPSYW